MKLTDAQVTSLSASDATLRQGNAERFAIVDSLKKLMKPSTGGQPSVEDQARIAIAQDAMMVTMDAIRSSSEMAAKESVATLDAEQQNTAVTLLEKHHEEKQKMLRDNLGAAAGRPRGRGRRPGR